MCGILGFAGTRDFGRESFVRARDVMERRGPDGEGLLEEADILLGFRRLAILDLSSAGAQPMESACGRYVIAFNGEIYNFRELRKGLEERGVVFRSTGDTEVLLELFAREGEKCLSALRGMFAFAIWDRVEKSLFLARDRFGIKPLYLWKTPSTLAFASAVKAIRALPGAPRAVSRAAVEGYLYWGSVPEPLTIIAGIEALPPATWLRWKAGASTAGRYWAFPSNDSSRKTRDEVLETLRPVLLEAVRLHCISDAPLGAFLSGGIDSSAVVSLMRAVGQPGIHTFSISFPGSALDESAYASLVAKEVGTRHENVPVAAGQVWSLLLEFFGAMDQPSFDGVNTFLVSRLSRQAGLTVALSGLGGDELFAGYPTPRRVARVAGLTSRVPRTLLRGVSAAAAGLPGRRARKLEALGLPGQARANAYFLSRGAFMPSDVRRILAGPVAAPPPVLDEDEPLPEGALHHTLAVELRAYTRNQLLRDSDAFGMGNSQEIRVPLLDHLLAEEAFRAPEHVITEVGLKGLLRDALPQPLPRICTHRPKMGFTFPFDSWLRGPWKGAFDRLSSEPPPSAVPGLRPGAFQAEWQSFVSGGSSWYRPWALASLILWLEAQEGGVSLRAA